MIICTVKIYHTIASQTRADHRIVTKENFISNVEVHLIINDGLREKFTSPIDSKINKCFQWRMVSTEFGYNSLAEMLDLGADTYLRFQKHGVPMRVYPKQHPSIKF